MKLLVATKNKGKIKEIADILADLGIEVESLLDYPEIPDVVEDGKTFEENAIKKAKTISEHFRQIVLADDSGFEVDALGGEPGVYSARYAGPNATGTDLCEKVLVNLKNVPLMERTCRFRCVIALVDGENVVTVDGSVEGRVTDAIQGEGGFGYDPIFFYEEKGCTFAQMTRDEKNKVSHRGRALDQIKKILVKYQTLS